MEDVNQTKEEIKTLFETGRVAKTSEEFLEKMNQALKLAQSIEDYSLQVEIQTSLACGDILDGNWEQYRNKVKLVRNLLEELGDPVLEVRVLYSFGETIAYVGDLATSNVFYHKALVVAKNSNQFDSIADLLAILGMQTAQIPTETSLELQHNLTESLEYFNEGLEIVIENNLSLNKKASILQNCGIVYMNMGNKDLALENYNSALEIAEEIEDNFLKQKIMDNLRILGDA